MNFFVLLAIASVVLGSLSQVLLKKAALKDHGSFIKEYMNLPVVVAYGLLGMTTLLNTVASQKMSLTVLSAIDSLGYVFVLLLSFFVLKEKIGNKKLMGMGMIVAGVLVFTLL